MSPEVRRKPILFNDVSSCCEGIILVTFGCIPVVPSWPSLSVLLTSRLGRRHTCLTISHTVPGGQQPRKSGQQTAPRPYLQQPHCPGTIGFGQHFVPFGHWYLPPGHVTCNYKLPLPFTTQFNIHLIQMNITLKKIPKSQFTIYSPIFLPKILQRPFLTNLQTQYKMKQRICLALVRVFLLR